MSFHETFQALADPNRQKILRLLKRRDLAVGDILAKLSITGASLSHHLAVLRRADLVSARREGQQIIYSLNLSVLEELIQEITGLIRK
jgi:DNA-binding transcriptional ArsR family regulator